MTKKDLAAFMKQKLAQTKIGSTVTTQQSATGPSKTNFNKQKPPAAKPLNNVKRTPVFQKPPQDSSDDDDWAKANQMLNKPL